MHSRDRTRNEPAVPEPDLLEDWGWTPCWEAYFRAFAHPGWEPARVIRADRGMQWVRRRGGERRAQLPGRWFDPIQGGGDLPAVGDWVAIEPLPGEDQAIIRAILPRRTCFARKAAGPITTDQVLAANWFSR